MTNHICRECDSASPLPPPESVEVKGGFFKGCPFKNVDNKMRFVVKLWSLSKLGGVDLSKYAGWVIEGVLEVEKIWRSLNNG